MTTITDAVVIRHPARARAIAWEKAWWVPLAAILAVQALYTIRLVPLGLASPDEARYIYAGHQLIHEFWHGGGSPYYETYFSGAPDIYSPFAAIADHLGGLTEIRLMSLCFMLAATSLLFMTGHHLHGYLPGMLAAGLFAGLGPTQVVGRNTIYDALAFMLTAVAAYCAARARNGQPRWLLLVPVTLATAFFAKYMTVLFDPVVIGLASLGTGSFRRGLHRLLVLSGATGGLLGLLTYLAGGAYVRGMMFTVFARKTGADVILNAVPIPGHEIIQDSLRWIGVTVAVAAVAVVITLVVPHERRHLPTTTLCLAAGLLVTVEALHLHSAESMRRHDDLGAWFAAIPAGYALALPVQRAKASSAQAILVLAACLTVALSWAHYSQLSSNFLGQTGYDSGYNPPAGPPAYRLLRPYLELKGASYLLSGNDGLSLVYNDHLAIPWYNLFDDSYIKYPIPGRGGDWHGQKLGPACFSVKPGCIYLTGKAGYEAAVGAHIFALISLTRPAGQQVSTDSAIEQAVQHTPGYVLLTRIGGAPTWIYAPAYRALAHHAPAKHILVAAHSVPVKPSALAVARMTGITLLPSAAFVLVGAVLLPGAAWARRRHARSG